jgi:hypothetical protein
MRVRAIDNTGDWTFGAGLSNYRSANAAVAQCIQTRLLSFLGDCFFDLDAGIDWLNFLGGSKSQLAVNLAVSARILNTNSQGINVVVGLLQLSINLNSTTRTLSIAYQVQSIYSVTALTNTFSYDLGGSI